MPTIINGCGTYYYGRRNSFSFQGTCKHCGKEAVLASYDTTLYFVLFLIPIFPLGKKRIVNQCPKCTRHHAIALSEWDAMRAKSEAEALQAWKNDSGNRALAMDALHVPASFQDAAAVARACDAVSRGFTDDAEMQREVACLYMDFKFAAEAEKCFHASLRVADESQTREGLAYLLLKTGRPESARPYVQHIIQDEIPDRIWLLMLLAESFQQKGRHREALELLKSAEIIVPQIAGEKKHKKLRKSAEKYQNSDKTLKSKNLALGFAGQGKERDFGGKFALFLWPTILLGIFGSYAAASWMNGMHRSIYLVSGLDVPYSVVINGQPHLVRPNARQAITIREGNLHLEAGDDVLKMEPQDIRIRTNFLVRPFLDRTFVVNPDRLAPLFWEKVYYSGNPNKAPEGDGAYHVGELVYEFKGIDYEFEDFPASLRLSEGSVVARERIDLQRGIAPEYIYSQIAAELPAEGIELLQRKLEYTPDNLQIINALSALMPYDDYIAYCRNFLDDRPIRVNWHRMYQSTVEHHDPQYDLSAEYQVLLDAEPGNPDLQYLLGRTLIDRTKALELYRRAADQDNAYALMAIGIDFMVRGEFEEAIPYAKKAHLLSPDDELLQNRYIGSLEGAGHFDEILDELLPDLATVTVASRFVYFTARRDGGEAAREKARQIRLKLKTIMGDAADQLKENHERMILCVEGDLDQLFAIMGSSSPEYDFWVHLVQNRCDLALEDMNGLGESATAYHGLALYCAAEQSQNAEIAKASLELAANELAKGYVDERYLASVLKGEEPPNHERLVNSIIAHEQKRYHMAALGFRFPEKKQEYFALADKLNYTRALDYYPLKSILESAQQSP